VTPAIVKGTISMLEEVGAIPVVDALADRSEARVLRAMGSMARTHTGDPTLKLLALVSRNVVQWLHAAALLSQKADPDEISQRIGLHPWLVKTKVLPVARKWKEEPLSKLLGALARVERGAKSGHVRPWVELEATLITAIRRARGG